jgi:hypothetical protein
MRIQAETAPSTMWVKLLHENVTVTMAGLRGEQSGLKFFEFWSVGIPLAAFVLIDIVIAITQILTRIQYSYYLKEVSLPSSAPYSPLLLP